MTVPALERPLHPAGQPTYHPPMNPQGNGSGAPTSADDKDPIRQLADNLKGLRDVLDRDDDDPARRLIDELVLLRAILDRKNLQHMYARCGAIYEELQRLGLTRKQVAQIAGLSPVGMDWGKKAAAERGAGLQGTRTTTPRSKKKQAGSP